MSGSMGRQASGQHGVANTTMKELAVLDRVRKTITRYNMLPESARVAVAVSGGPDSVCLLHVLAELAPEYGIQLSVAHFNHGLRGAESDEDERVVADLAAGMGLPFHHSAAAVPPVKENLGQAAKPGRRAVLPARLPPRRSNLLPPPHPLPRH